MPESLWGKILRNFWDKYGEGYGIRLEPDMLYTVERDDGYQEQVNIYTYMTKVPSEWSMVFPAILKFSEGRVLDVGCGSGRLSLYLQEKGFDVKAIDYDPNSVYVAEQRGLNDVELMDIYNATLKQASFDTVLVTGIGELVQDKANTRKLISIVTKILKKAGVVIGTSAYCLPDTPDEEYLIRHNRQVRSKIIWQGQTSDWLTALSFTPDILSENINQIFKFTDVFEALAYLKEGHEFIHWGFVARRV